MLSSPSYQSLRRLDVDVDVRQRQSNCAADSMEVRDGDDERGGNRMRPSSLQGHH